MTELTISDVWSGEEEDEAYVAAADDVKDDVDDVKDDVVNEVKYDVADDLELLIDAEVYKTLPVCQADVPDFSELDPADGRLFPNIPDLYRVTVKWLVDPHQDHREKPPLYISGCDPSDCESPEYAGLDLGLTSNGIKVGQQFDIVSLLSSSRLLRVGAGDDHFVEPQTLKHKYVVIICVFAPTRWVDRNCKALNQLRIVSQQLSEAENFEMVIVPKMRKCCATSKTAFNMMVSAFNGCLFVPFEDNEVRDKICQCLKFCGFLKVVLLDTNHKVAQDNVCDIVANYYYPRTGENSTKLKYLTPNWIRPPLSLGERIKTYVSSSLAWILDTSYGDVTLRLPSLSSSSDESVTVGELSEKLVGVYLFQKGDKLDSLIKVYDQCKDQKLEFEIVVVCMSLFTTVDPLLFFNAAIGELEKMVSDRPWWVLPYNAATYATLFDLNMWCPTDTMITVGPSRKFFVDVNGGDVVHCYGIQAYPFHREMIVRKYLLGAKSITLDSLLSYGDVDYVLRGDGKQIKVAQLHDKVVLVYTDPQSVQNGCKCKTVCKWYHEIRKQHSDFEVVIVPYGKHEDDDSDEEKYLTPDMDVLVRPYDPVHCKLLRKKESIFDCEDGYGFPVEGLGPDCTLLFGKGGQLCSLNAIARFFDYGIDGYPYESGCGDDYLRQEIVELLASELCDFMSNYMYERPIDVVSLD